MVAHSPRAFPWEMEPPVGIGHVTGKRHRRTRGRRPRARSCLRRGCRRRYRPRRYNQRYCRDPQCLREVHRWQAARRKAKQRQRPNVKTKHAQDEKARRQRVKVASQTVESPELARARGHAAQTSFSLPSCDRPGCHEHPANSHRNQARYCCPGCRQAVRNVLDRERKWRVRSTLAGQKKRAIEYQAARARRAFRQGRIPNPPPSRPLPR